MTKISSSSDIKYTMLAFDKDEIHYAKKMVKSYLQDVNIHDATVDFPAESNGIYGFTHKKIGFWHPVLYGGRLQNDWTAPIVKEYACEDMLILQGAPSSYSVVNAVKDVTGDDSFVVMDYDTWRTENGLVAVSAS